MKSIVSNLPNVCPLYVARPPRGIRHLILALLIISLPMAGNAADDSIEIQRTWENGLAYAMINGEIISGKIPEILPRLDDSYARNSLPALVYMHGCSGITNQSRGTATFYAQHGFAIFMPDSFARKNKPASCKPRFFKGGLHRGVLEWRHNEANNAIRKVRSLGFIQSANLFLIGLSEGAITTATVSGEPVSGRIVEGWTCHSGWPEYFGLNSRKDEPVLSLLGEEDPWFVAPYLRGHCGEFMNKANGSRSVIFKPPHRLTDFHFVMWHASAQKEALEFLRKHMIHP